MPLNEMSDEEILSKIRELKKNEALYSNVIKRYYEEIYNRYYLQCYNISRYYGLSRQDAEDVVQETFLKFILRGQTFDRAKNFKPWFFKILLNTIKDRFKYLKRNKVVNLDYFPDVRDTTQERKMEELQIRDTLLSIIYKLPEKLKNAVLLRNYTDLSLETIANISDITVRQLHNRLSKAYSIILKNLKK
ncbi:MAG: RNA polymerase sigma factor [Brevinematia bacterium]